MQSTQMCDTPPLVLDLYGNPQNPPPKRSHRKSSRKQSRREAWQDSQEPSLSHFALFGETTHDLISELPPYLHEIASHVIANLSKPVSLPVGVPEDDAREIMSVVYRLRFEARTSLYVEGDPQKGRDYVDAISEICKLYREEMLASKGFRSAAHGISKVTNAAGEVTKYRVQSWGDTEATDGSIRTGHIHVAYCDTIEEAYRKQAEWWLKHRKIDLTRLVPFHPESAIAALAALMRDAAVNSGTD